MSISTIKLVGADSASNVSKQNPICVLPFRYVIDTLETAKTVEVQQAAALNTAVLTRAIVSIYKRSVYITIWYSMQYKKVHNEPGFYYY